MARKSEGKDNLGYEDDRTTVPHDKSTDAVKRKFYDEDEKELYRYGWLSWRPSFLQCCHNTKGYLFFICIYVCIQGMVASGMIFAVITTLERRFSFTSTQSGMIVSVYDFAAMCALVFVTYYGDRGSKPLYLGSGAFLFGLGSIIFALPHFLTDNYRFEGTFSDTCNATRPVPDRCSGNTEDLSSYYVVFIIAQVILGLGSTPLYTLGIAYLDENTRQRNGAFYIGVFQAAAVLGIALGFITGGSMLEIYVDINADQDALPINSSSPLWVGAWWLGFLICGCINMVIAIPLLGFGRRLPGSRKKQEERKSETQAGANFTTKPGFGQSLRDFPRAAWTLLKNPPYMFLTLAGCTELFIVTSVTAFGPKYFESVFNMTSSSAAILTGLIGLLPGLTANLFSGWLIKSYDMKVPGMMKYMLGCLILVLMGSLSFLWICPNPDFAGVTVQYGNKSISYPDGKDANVTAGCNANCNCEYAFDPVCGSDDVRYFTACYAGCKTELEPNDSSVKRYADCSCIPDEISPVQGGTADTGQCQEPCWTLVGFMIILFLITLLSFNVIVPSFTSTLRCVDSSQRSFALGLQSLIVRGLGLIPGPIVYGAIVDDTCLIWEESCSGGWICWMYENRQLSYLTVALVVGLRVGSVIFLLLALLTYKPGITAKESEHKPVSEKKEVPSEESEPQKVDHTSIGVQAKIPSNTKKSTHGSIQTTEL